MESRKGFTLVELMVVILIVGILAAVAIPIMRGRIDSAKWSEGRSMMGTIASAIRAYVAERDRAPAGSGNAMSDSATASELGFRGEDFDGTYFLPEHFSYEATYIPAAVGEPNELKFTITGENTALTPDYYELDEEGVWTWGDR